MSRIRRVLHPTDFSRASTPAFKRAVARGAAQKQIRKLVEKAKRAGARVKGLLLEGVAHERIAQAARARKADLVVIGTHGRTGFAKLFLGSVASRMLAVSPCPVLTVRGK
jgi:nucleotide-binding universal stress UspA family protein